ncbi:peptidogalycan biosysnthesis protein [Macrococcus armenti]|uniref:peptidogalycan biosysnthesis protein n=1 Tax=Macrococcus armenti TaxID=2875764 RepID=UPI001CCDC192|nr:GNAT family N-acetyltransferase [Macrococcus armenti]UBH15236.1 GNAT family N-acetyltransferase [Macrococcus armenti]UBH17595.1 GNAT family N-acetyltransferase [Macrococcus armenti]UBH19861.1 GNAT family N-acetyltransferase [Macrococcus armenti]
MTFYSTYDEIPFDRINIGVKEHEYLRYMMEGITRGIENVEARVEVMVLNGQLIPFSIKDGGKDQSWIHSFTGQYIDEMVNETSRMNLPAYLKPVTNAILTVGRFVLDPSCEQTITVFPSFMSTTMYEGYEFEQIELITKTLCERFPEHAICFRTVNDKFHTYEMELLHEAGYERLISRAVYIYDSYEQHNKNERKDLKKDIKKFNKSGLTFTMTLNDEDFEQLVPLYEQVYLDKYSNFNPHYTAEFFKFMYASTNLQWFVLKDEARIVSFMAVQEAGNVLFPAYFGMDQSMKHLYFITSGLLYGFARRNGYCINNSAGAKDYKLARGSRPYLEYHFVYVKHLSPLKQLHFLSFMNCATRIGERALKQTQFS